jgi:hypothetical protein
MRLSSKEDAVNYIDTRLLRLIETLFIVFVNAYIEILEDVTIDVKMDSIGPMPIDGKAALLMKPSDRVSFLSLKFTLLATIGRQRSGKAACGTCKSMKERSR